MGEDFFRLLSTGLLALILLLLLLVLSQLGRLRKALDQGGPARASAEVGTEDDKPEPALDEPVAEKPTDSDATPAAGLAAAAVASDEPATETAQPAADEEGPYEQDGRWWFRRDGELLVYDEQQEQWVDANAPGAGEAAVAVEPEPVAQSVPATGTPYEPVAQTEPAAEPEPHPLDEARDWTAPEPAGTTPVPVVGSTPEPAPVASEPAPAAAEPEPASAAPIQEPVTAPEPITENTETQEQPAASGGHWKCPSCGVINGSTASSCRMCFAARP